MPRRLEWQYYDCLICMLQFIVPFTISLVSAFDCHIFIFNGHISTILEADMKYLRITLTHTIKARWFKYWCHLIYQHGLFINDEPHHSPFSAFMPHYFYICLYWFPLRYILSNILALHITIMDNFITTLLAYFYFINIYVHILRHFYHLQYWYYITWI